MISEKREVVGYWRTDEPPNDRRMILGVWGNKMVFVSFNPLDCGGTWRGGDSFHTYQRPRAWAEVEAPEKSPDWICPKCGGVWGRLPEDAESITCPVCKHREPPMTDSERLDALEERLGDVNGSDWDNRLRIICETANRVDGLEAADETQPVLSLADLESWEKEAELHSKHLEELIEFLGKKAEADA